MSPRNKKQNECKNILCIECGIEMSSTAKFCPKCGARQPVIDANDAMQKNEKSISSIKSTEKQNNSSDNITLTIKRNKNNECYLDKESEKKLASFFSVNGLKNQSNGFRLYMQRFFEENNEKKIEGMIKKYGNQTGSSSNSFFFDEIRPRYSFQCYLNENSELNDAIIEIITDFANSLQLSEEVENKVQKAKQSRKPVQSKSFGSAHKHILKIAKMFWEQ